MKGFGSCWRISVSIVDEPKQRSLARKSKSIVKSREENADDSSPFTSLPDEIILQILNKVIDLKSLCFCYVVSKRFSSIVLQVDAVSFTAPLLNSPDKKFFPDVDGDRFRKKLFRRLINGVVFKPVCLLRRKIGAPRKPLPPSMSSFYCESFLSAIKSIRKFKEVKSLSLELPNSRHKRIDNSLFKWKAQFGTTIESIFFLWPNSISETDRFNVNANGEDGEEEQMDLSNDQVEHFYQCIEDVIIRHIVFWVLARNRSMLEEVSITESGRRGRLSISGGKLAQVKKDFSLSKLYSMGIPSGLKHCYIPVLNLPVSGYEMKGVNLLVLEVNGFQVGIGNDDLMNSDEGFDFEDKEEAAYNEALMEILEKHMGKMKVIP